MRVAIRSGGKRMALLRLGAIVLAMVAGSAAVAAERAAIVIANGGYEAGRLATAAADGKLVGTVFREAGYDVLLLEEARAADWPEFLRAVASHTRGAGSVVLYFNGYALASREDNLMLPVDLKPGSEEEIRRQSLPVTALMAALDQGAKARILFFDAVAPPPVAISGPKPAEGLAEPPANARREGAVLTLAATPGVPIARQESAGNGVFAIALANALSTPGIEMGTGLREIRRSVREATRGVQMPASYGARLADFVFRPPAPPEPPAPTVLPPFDQIMWRFVRDSADEGDLTEFTALFPQSPLTERALARRVRLASATEVGIGSVSRAIGGRNVVVTPVKAAEDIVVATTGDRAPPAPLRSWPRELPEVREGLRGRITRCDELAADPDDPMRVAPGVAWNLVNRRVAARACVADLVRDPENPRLRFQLGRVLDIMGQHAWAEGFYRSAADKVYGGATINLAYMHLTGRGRDVNLPEAVRLMRVAADLGNARARTDLGQSYLDGRGVEQSPAEALLWLRLAGAHGWPNAIDVLGNMYQNGRGVAKDDGNAAKLFAASANVGNTNAMVNLGRAYLEGKGVKQDAGTAKTWFEQSSAAGNPFAPFWLAKMTDGGWGVPKDARKAQEYYLLSANRGFGEARYELAQILERGEPKKKPDLVEAAFNYALTGQTTYEIPVSQAIIDAAKGKLASIRAKLSPAEQATVDRRVEEWIRLNGS